MSDDAEVRADPSSTASGAVDCKRLLDAFVQQAAAFALFAAQGVISARWLGPAGKGELVLALQLGSLAANAVMLGVPASLGSALSRGLASARQATVVGLLALFAASLVGVLASAVAGRWVPDAYSVAVGFLPLSVLLVGLSLLVQAFAYGMGESSIGMLTAITSNGLMVVGYVVLWVTDWANGATFAVGVWLVSIAMGNVCGLLLLRRRVLRGQPMHPGSGVGRYVVTRGVKNVAGPLLMALNTRLDVLILGCLLVPSAVGVYSVAVSVGALCQVVPQAFALALTRSFGEGRYSRETVTTIFRLSLFGSIGVGLGLSVVVWPLVPLVFGPPFAQAAPMSALMLLPLAGFSTLLVSSQFALHRLDRPAYQSLIVGLTLTVDVGLLFALAPALGVWAAPIASATSSALGSVINVAQMARWTGSCIFRLLTPQRGDVALVRRVVKTWRG